ncbi:MAG: ROK family protein [Planctomycetes bacterium]|jgi:glucokinase|nr:ROK family protein [Planctomycetota bacterium]MCL4731626.1 ROK family protein [Planctomycetota bacterium]
MRVGVDFGGTNIKAALVEGAGVRAHASVPTRGEAGPAAVLDNLAAAVRQLGARAEVVGVAIPGEVDDRGVCYRLPNVPGFDGYPLRAELERRLGCPVHLENDATAAAVAEQRFGWGTKYRSFLLVTLGTGIGGGLVLDGAVRRGRGGFAGEIGHVLVDSTPGAWPCGCGLKGCMEAYAGARGLLRHDSEHGGSATEVRQIVDAGGQRAQRLFDFLARALGAGLARLNNALDLDALVFTGGVAGSFAAIEPPLRAHFAAHSYAPPMGAIPMQVSKLGEHAGVIGAAWLG